MNKETNLGRWYLIPTISKNPYQQNRYYRFAQYIEPGRPTVPEPAEPENMDCSLALSVIANIKAGL